MNRSRMTKGAKVGKGAKGVTWLLTSAGGYGRIEYKVNEGPHRSIVAIARCGRRGMRD